MRSTLTLLAPITSTDNKYPLHVRIAPGNPVDGFVQCEAMRAMDLGVRDDEGKAEIVGRLDDDTLSQVIACALVVMGVEEI